MMLSLNSTVKHLSDNDSIYLNVWKVFSRLRPSFLSKLSSLKHLDGQEGVR